MAARGIGIPAQSKRLVASSLWAKPSKAWRQQNLQPARLGARTLRLRAAVQDAGVLGWKLAHGANV